MDQKDIFKVAAALAVPLLNQTAAAGKALDQTDIEMALRVAIAAVKTVQKETTTAGVFL